MSILEAVIVIAGVIKQIADDSSANESMVKSLATRVEIIPRILKKIPENNELDADLLNRMHNHLKEAHRLLLKHQTRNSVTKMIKASSARLKFSNVETELGRCIDDLSFNIGITSAAILDDIRADIRKEQGVTTGDGDLTSQCEETENMKELEEEGLDLADFDEMVNNMENLSSSIKLFSTVEEHNSSAAGTTGTVKNQASNSTFPAPSIVLYGEKLIIQNLQKPTESSPKSKAATSYIEYNEETQEENILLTSSGINTSYNNSSNSNTGIIIFHIDNTSSMLREKRMELTKAVLRKVIPKFLRWGFRIVVNAWASTDANKGRISTREVCPSVEIMQGLTGTAGIGSNASSGDTAGDSGSAEVEQEAAEESLAQYLDKEVFDILVPKGRTDLYGSCFQLLQQCKHLLHRGSTTGTRGSSNSADGSGPVYAFVLTDGEHNKLDCPTHRPTREDEDYFGVYTAVRNVQSGKLKFQRTGEQPSVALCEARLRSELDQLNTARGDNNSFTTSTKNVTVTLIGIGDAETKPLSALTRALGEYQCSFYGITQVDQSEAVFQDISAASSCITVTCANSTEGGAAGLQLPVSFTFEEEAAAGTVVLQGSAVAITDHSALLHWHHTNNLTLTQPFPSSSTNTTSMQILTSIDITKQFDKFASEGSKNTFEYESQRIKMNELLNKIEEFVSEIRKIRSTVYNIEVYSYDTVYKQLLLDKKKIQSIKNNYYSKYNRKYRAYSLFTGLSVWLKELESLTDHQLTSYRMNVEAEILNRIVESGKNEMNTTGGVVASGGKGSSSGGGYLQPTDVVLHRLQNNLHNAGRSTHKVLRHVAAISSIRERTMHIAGTLFTTSLSMQYLYATSADITATVVGGGGVEEGRPVKGLRLTVSRACRDTAASKTFTVDWIGMSATAVSQLIDACVSVREIGYEKSAPSAACLSLPKSLKQRSAAIESVVFPCILLRAKFNQFTIIRATYLFFTSDIVTEQDTIDLPDTSGPVTPDLEFPLAASVYCAQEIWELCHSSNHIVGEVLPLGYYASHTDLCAPSGANMMLPLAYTPLLFALYVERSRAYHSAVNVTADCMALTVVSFQWAKFYHDALLFTAGAPCPAPQTSSVNSPYHPKLRVFLDQACKAIVALSYCIDSAVMLPSKAGLNTMFGQSTQAADAGCAMPEPSDEDIIQPCVVMSRDDCPSLTAPLAIAAIVAGGHLPYAERACTWNLLLRTLYSRLAEAISGQKNVRHSVSTTTTTAPASVTDSVGVQLQEDPGALEHDYRLKLGYLQGLLRKRLHVEWVKCTAAEKRIQVQACAEPVLQCLRDIAEKFLLRLDSYGLQSWAQVGNMVSLSLALYKHGIMQLRQQLIECGDLSSTIDQLLTAGKEYSTAPLLLPICVQSTTIITTGSSSGNSTGQLQLREAQVSDIDHIVMYIDAIVATRAVPKVEYKPIVNPSFPIYSAADNRALHFRHNTIEWDESLPSVNIAFIGNVNSGKSSISGMLLSSLQIIPDAVVTRLGEEAVKLGYSDSLKHAWVMDTSSHERSGGFTIKPTWAGFQTNTRRYTIIDNPGHKDYNRNAAIGVYQADAVVLVMPADIISTELHTEVNNNNNTTSAATASSSINATTELFSQQAEEHLITAFCFGVREVVVAVNKMDLVQYSQAVFEEVKTYTLKLLKKAGFKADSAVFVPVSVIHNEGLTHYSAASALSTWYSGPCLLQACDELPAPRRTLEKSFRMVVDEIYQHRITSTGAGTSRTSTTSAVLCGKIERGSVSLQDTVSLYPGGPLGGVVKSLQLHGTSVSEAQAGDNVGIQIQFPATATAITASSRAAGDRNHHKKKKTTTSTTTGSSSTSTAGTSKSNLLKGSILTLSSQTPVTIIHRFEAQLLVLHNSSAFKIGYEPNVTTHSVTVNVHITRLIELLGRNNTVLETNPTAVKVGQTVVCEMTALRPFVGETIHDMPKLSRFLIKSDRRITAIGFIRKILN